jgi:hypothetical protein
MPFQIVFLTQRREEDKGAMESAAKERGERREADFLCVPGFTSGEENQSIESGKAENVTQNS